jgi:hypothetical protein
MVEQWDDERSRVEADRPDRRVSAKWKSWERSDSTDVCLARHTEGVFTMARTTGNVQVRTRLPFQAWVLAALVAVISLLQVASGHNSFADQATAKTAFLSVTHLLAGAV